MRAPPLETAQEQRELRAEGRLHATRSRSPYRDRLADESRGDRLRIGALEEQQPRHGSARRRRASARGLAAQRAKCRARAGSSARAAPKWSAVRPRRGRDVGSGGRAEHCERFYAENSALRTRNPPAGGGRCAENGSMDLMPAPQTPLEVAKRRYDPIARAASCESNSSSLPGVLPAARRTLIELFTRVIVPGGGAALGDSARSFRPRGANSGAGLLCN